MRDSVIPYLLSHTLFFIKWNFFLEQYLEIFCSCKGYSCLKSSIRSPFCRVNLPHQLQAMGLVWQKVYYTLSGDLIFFPNWCHDLGAHIYLPFSVKMYCVKCFLRPLSAGRYWNSDFTTFHTSAKKHKCQECPKIWLVS